MGVLITIAQLILSLSILIVLHEFGHFLPARLFGIRVEKFYLFFNPKFELWKRQIGETEYGIGWLPLGGYVKIAGMMDESFDKEQLAQEPQPWEFRTKPAWQRLIVMLGGVTVNFILGFLIWAMLLWVWGKSYLPTENATYGMAADSVAQTMGFIDGDIIMKLDGQPTESVRTIRKDIFLKSVEKVTVKRNGSNVDLPFDVEKRRIVAKYKGDFLVPRFPFVIDSLPANSHNAEADIQKGDKIISFNSEPTLYFSDVQRALNKNKGSKATLQVLRNERDTVNVPVEVSETAKLGIFYYPANDYLKFQTKEYSLGQALPQGFRDANDFLFNTYIKSLGKLFTGEAKASESLGGFGAIGGMFGQEWIWERFWRMTAILSLILAFMNLLPIPALDGGHVMFLLWEVVTGRKPNDKVLEYSTIVGFVIVLGLVIFANGLDILRAIGWIK